MMNGINAIKTAITCFEGQQGLAAATGYTQQAVSKWLSTGKVSAEAAKKIEKATGGAVKAADLRPDIFG